MIMRVMGVDPGISTTGFGIISDSEGRLSALSFGGIKTPSDLPLQTRLKRIYDELSGLIKAYSPDVMVVEELFFNRNITSAFTVGMARGVALLAAEMSGLPVSSYTPLQVKQAIVGYGRATKWQVQRMVKALLGLKDLPSPDAADALALAICHINSHRLARLLHAPT